MKCKTHKALAKRVRVTKTGKVMKRCCGQDHFNTRDPGKITRKKRRDTELSRSHVKAFRTLLPYSKVK
ncbi:TPA: 50S ribosomal protein L35 [Candidatus Uhrbacteria bacterium]|nr:50S ribosomal protein L35 [Candidatus Uhrbacteria bacterium]HCU31468.1 50S ribosomal protein L35 [Candidatus Uhrbacteria bacterium]